jgi:sulfide dehydrogenase cytochrome subunit
MLRKVSSPFGPAGLNISGPPGWKLLSACRLAAAVVIAAFLVPTATADETAPDVLANACAACHGTDGMSPGAIPTLQGLPSGEIETMLRSFRSGELEGTVMNRIAKGYTDLEIKALARYFGSLGG